MTKATNTVARQAKKLWDDRDLRALTRLCATPEGARDPKAHFFGGLAYHALNDKRRAIECWRAAAALDPSYVEPTRALAYELTEQDDFIDAAELFQSLIRLGKATADDLTSLGEIRVQQDRLAEARQLLEKALELDPKNALALVALATVHTHMRNRAAALDYLRRAAETDEIDLEDLRADAAFQPLWDDPQFRRLVAGR
jgi:tetratricopeptide (TPR) repeat protein